MITLKLLAWVVVILIFVAWDYYEIVKKKTRPNYLLENIIKGALLSCIQIRSMLGKIPDGSTVSLT